MISTLCAHEDELGGASMVGEAVRGLRGRTRGEVIEPAEIGYEEAREAYNAMATGRPDIIFRPADLPDIVAAVRWAEESGLAIGVRGGGHSVAGHSSPDRALLIDLSRWRGATVDPAARTADALAGCRLMDLDAATYAHGLAAAVRYVHRHRHRGPDPERRDQLARLVRGLRLRRADRRPARDGGR